MANLYRTTYKIRIGPNGPAKATVTQSYVWSGKFGRRDGPTGVPPLTSGTFDFYDDENSRFGVIYHDDITGVTFGSEVDCDLDDGDNGQEVDVSIEEKEKVFFHKDHKSEHRGDWVRK